MNYTEIKTFEDACKALGIEPTVPDFSMMPQKHQKALAAHSKLIIIAEAVNEGWTPNWSDTDEYKYELFPDIEEDSSKPSGFGLSYYDYDDWATYTTVGSRLCFQSREKAKHTFETFKELFEDYLLIG
jgi:hypothetical protein